MSQRLPASARPFGSRRPVARQLAAHPVSYGTRLSSTCSRQLQPVFFHAHRVDHWDNEKERLVLLCGRTLIIVKYDFIALMLLDHARLPLNEISQLTIGRLVYPQRSITP